MADYPGAIKNFLQLEDGVDTVVAQHPNERGDEITAIETELGTNVAGSSSDLKTRLAEAIADDGKLKNVYDSGWFAFALSGTYTKTHNLGTTKILWAMYVSPNNDDTEMHLVASTFIYAESSQHYGGSITHQSATEVIVNIASSRGFPVWTEGGQPYTRYDSGYLRIIGIALE